MSYRCEYCREELSPGLIHGYLFLRCLNPSCAADAPPKPLGQTFDQLLTDEDRRFLKKCRISLESAPDAALASGRTERRRAG